MTVSDLVERLEGAADGDPGIDVAIWNWDKDQFQGSSWEWLDLCASRGNAVPPFTSRIDVARTLIPRGHTFACGDLGEDESPWATITTSAGADIAASAATPSLALCIAALKARAALTSADPTGAKP